MGIWGYRGCGSCFSHRVVWYACQKGVDTHTFSWGMLPHVGEQVTFRQNWLVGGWLSPLFPLGHLDYPTY